MRSKVYGYDQRRTEQWKKNLEEWEIAIIEFMCKKFMKKLSYKPITNSKNILLVKKGIKNLNKNRLLRKRLNYFLSTGKGTDLKMNDPSDPKNWGSKYFANKKFVNDPDYQTFLTERKNIEIMINRLEI